MRSLCLLLLATSGLLFIVVCGTRSTSGSGKVPLGVSRASVKISLANKHLAGPKVALNPRQEELEKKLLKAKKKLQQTDVTEKNGAESNEKNSVIKKDKIDITGPRGELTSEQRVTLKDLLRMKRATRN